MHPQMRKRCIFKPTGCDPWVGAGPRARLVRRVVGVRRCAFMPGTGRSRTFPGRIAVHPAGTKVRLAYRNLTSLPPAYGRKPTDTVGGLWSFRILENTTRRLAPCASTLYPRIRARTVAPGQSSDVPAGLRDCECVHFLVFSHGLARVEGDACVESALRELTHGFHVGERRDVGDVFSRRVKPLDEAA